MCYMAAPTRFAAGGDLTFCLPSPCCSIATSPGRGDPLGVGVRDGKAGGGAGLGERKVRGVGGAGAGGASAEQVTR